MAFFGNWDSKSTGHRFSFFVHYFWNQLRGSVGPRFSFLTKCLKPLGFHPSLVAELLGSQAEGSNQRGYVSDPLRTGSLYQTTSNDHTHTHTVSGPCWPKLDHFGLLGAMLAGSFEWRPFAKGSCRFRILSGPGTYLWV